MPNSQKLRLKHPHVALGDLFGEKKQSYYEALAHANEASIAQMTVLPMIKELRIDLPLLGTRNAYHLLAPEIAMHHIKMERDKLFDLLRFHVPLIRNRKRMVKTTNANHWLKRHLNLHKQLCITDPENYG